MPTAHLIRRHEARSIALAPHCGGNDIHRTGSVGDHATSTRDATLRDIREWSLHKGRLHLVSVATFLLAFLTAGSVSAQLRTGVHVSGLTSPVAFVQDPTDRSVQFVVQQGGRIRAVRSGVIQGADFLNLSGVISTGGERGLLGMVFAPDYASSGRFFVNFTNSAGDTVVARFKRSTNPLVADASSRFDLRWGGASGLAYIDQPYTNHNGGHLAFGPDGYLYIGLGDGGSGDDPEHRAQNPAELLGKMLRVDVSVGDSDAIGYRIPSDNPFVTLSGARGEIWAFGLRNPWRYSFDDISRGGTGALVMGDVGQNNYEEINYQRSGASGRNYGWRNREGAHDHVTSLAPAYTPLTEPIYEYDHSVGESITGGFVYRGHLLGGAYRGRYFFADFISGRVWSLSLAFSTTTGEPSTTGVIEHTSQLGGQTTLGNISSFGVDADGELYIVSYSKGTVFKVLGPNPASDFDGDGKGEVGVYRTGTGYWYLRNSTQGYAVGAGISTLQWGGSGDVPLTGDFDGDGRSEVTVYRPSTGQWFVRLSSLAFDPAQYWYFEWGATDDVPLVSDFDGDGLADVAVYRPSTGYWYVRNSAYGYAVGAGPWIFQWGAGGDQPRLADFDGDTRTDVAVYRPSTGQWFIRYSSRNYDAAQFGYYEWGASGDVPINADWDGDGKAEIAVYRPSTGYWYLRNSTAGYAVGAGAWAFQWGAGGDVPLIEDLDGDGRAEIAVTRPTSGQWFIRYSSAAFDANQIGYFEWGVPNDRPLTLP